MSFGIRNTQSARRLLESSCISVMSDPQKWLIVEPRTITGALHMNEIIPSNEASKAGRLGKLSER